VAVDVIISPAYASVPLASSAMELAIRINSSLIFFEASADLFIGFPVTVYTAIILTLYE
jgi:hypothetical protein